MFSSVACLFFHGSGWSNGFPPLCAVIGGLFVVVVIFSQTVMGGT